MRTIVLTGGGTAGHCIPHIALLPYLKKDFDKIYYIGSFGGIEKSIIERENLPYYAVPTIKLARSFTFNNLKIPYILLKGISQAKKILKELKPDIVFSKGGYVALPVVFAAHGLKIPIISHESDFSVGLANKITAGYCLKVLTSFPETAKHIKNGEYVGSPVRKTLFTADRKTALAKFGFSGVKPILLVLGGSSGSAALNAALRDALPDIMPKFDVLHVCGKNNTDKSVSFAGYFQTEFLPDMENAYAVTDVCVSRAGSNAVFEILNLKLPAVLIPLPKGASRGDQELNAAYFERLGLMNVLPQSNLTAQSLIFRINSVYANRFNISRAFEKYPVRDASRQISAMLSELAR